LPSAISNESLGLTGIASPGATSQRWMRTVAITSTTIITSHDTVIIETAATNLAPGAAAVAGSSGGGRGTLPSVMVPAFGAFSSFGVSATSSVLATSTSGTTVRALWVVALALVALGAVSRMKPATPRRPATVRVDQKPTALYREPQKSQWKRALGMLTGWSVIVGALLACLAGLALAVALNLVGDLLRS
jgi:hypothetical protein